MEYTYIHLQWITFVHIKPDSEVSNVMLQILKYDTKTINELDVLPHTIRK